MAKHFPISRWTLTGKLFVSNISGFATAEEAEASARAKAQTYGDQTFSHTVEANSFNQAKQALEAQRLRREV